MKNSMIKGILFDKDGTLIEFQSVWHEIIKRILRELKHRYHFSKSLIEELKYVSGYREQDFTRESIIQYAATSQIVGAWYAAILRVAGDEHKDITHEDLLRLFEDTAMEEDIEIQAMKGVKELLAYLKGEEYILGIATADTFHSTVFSLKRAGLLHYFDYIGCNEEGRKPKPEQDMAVEFCERYGFQAKELLIVGDSVVDMQFAENAGANFIGIQTDYNDYEKFAENQRQSVRSIGDISLYFDL